MLSVRARHRLGDFELDVAFDAPDDGTTVLFGPSGAGKSATLAVIVGTLRAADARVACRGRVLTDTAARIRVPPELRRIGVVHQDARLFPHMPVRANLLYGWARAPGARPCRAPPGRPAGWVFGMEDAAEGMGSWISPIASPGTGDAAKTSLPLPASSPSWP